MKSKTKKLEEGNNLKIIELEKELRRCKAQHKAVIHFIIGNNNDVLEGDFSWSRTLEYVKLFKSRYDELRKDLDSAYFTLGYKYTMVIDIAKETEEAYKAFLEETGGINERGLSLPRFKELDYEERQRFMGMVYFLIKKYRKESDETIKGKFVDISETSTESELESEPKSQPKSRPTRQAKDQ